MEPIECGCAPMFLTPAVPDDPFFKAGPDGYHLVSRGGKPVWEPMPSWPRSGDADAGWTQLPSGIILQWGTAGVEDWDYISFPRSFPYACYNVSVTDRTVPPNGDIHVVGVGSRGVSQQGFTVRLIPTAANPGSPIYWIAIGI